MFSNTFKISRWKVALATVAFSALLVVPAAAADTVTQTVNAGTLTASIADVTMTAVGYSHSDQTQSDTMTLTADDSTGSDAGWNVTVQAADFTNAGSTQTFGASNLELTGYGTLTANSGQAVDTTATTPGGPKSGAIGTLDQTRMVLEAEAGYGKGNYDQVLNFDLTVPGQTLADTYTSTLTVTISSGPSGA